jgi:hypothetical protein
MRYFLNTMRAKYLKQCPYIVILSTKTLPHYEWEAISKFAKIIYIQGSPLLEEDLLRANVHRASRAVVLEIDQRENEDMSVFFAPRFFPCAPAATKTEPTR